ncbi:MAG: peptidylprolyl isomerase [Nitriliruptoraceae bacterium]
MAAKSGTKDRSTFARRQRRNRAIIIGMVVVLAVSLAAPLVTATLSRSADTTSASQEATEGPCGALPDDVPKIAAVVYDEPFGLVVDPNRSYTAVLETTCGDITVDLDAQSAPLAVSNLLMLAGDGYYDGVLFHRVLPGFVLQAGDPAGTGCGQDDCTQAGFDPNAPTFPGYRFDDELDTAQALYRVTRDEQIEELIAQGVIDQDELDDELRDSVPSGYPRGVLAMANAGPNTNGSQFFITLGEPTYLPGPQFTVFGEVTGGFDVLERIAASPTDELDRPRTAVALYRIVVSAG